MLCGEGQMLKIAREGVGWGAQKQFRLLRDHWGDFDAVKPPITLYWNAFTRDFPRLERRKNGGVTIVSRVGGWHFDTAEITGQVLEMSDGAIFVSDYTRRLAKKYFGDKLPKHQIVIPNSVPECRHYTLADPPYLLVRAGGLGWPIWKRHMLSRSLSIVALKKIWPMLRRIHPGLGLKIVGKADRKLKDQYFGDGIEYIDYVKDPDALHALGGKAAALVHLVIGDHSPNTVCEIIGEGRPAIVPDRGGARELAGRAGLLVEMDEWEDVTAEGVDWPPGRGEMDVWWPLDEKTYDPDVLSLAAAVGRVLETPAHWRKQARKRAGELKPKDTAAKYMDFLELCAK